MTTFRFFTNLRPQTVTSFERSGYEPHAWLLSSHRLTAETARLAAWVRENGWDLFADNGTHPMIGSVVDGMRPALTGLSADMRAVRRALPDNRRVPLAREVPGDLTERARAAVHEVSAAVDRLHAGVDGAELLDAQLRMDPTHLVAREDFAVACAMSLGLEREFTRLPVAWFRRRNRITLDFWEGVASDPRTRDIAVYATLGAVDYNTARAVAGEAAARGVEHVALGFAGINGDSTFVDRYLAGPGRALSGPAPRRYVRAAEVVCGLRDGYRDAGVRLRSFHALGLGARAQLPVLAAGFDWYTHLSTDATSPLHDSVRDRIFYDHEDWGARLHLTAAATRVLAERDWRFDCPFCPYVRERLGHRPDEARSWWDAAARPAVTVEHLDPAEPLGSSLPLFATSRGSETGVQTRARTAHNHWVIDHLAGEVPSRRRADWGVRQLAALEGMRTLTTRMGVQAAREVLTTLG